jgi:hypothetical protein
VQEAAPESDESPRFLPNFCPSRGESAWAFGGGIGPKHRLPRLIAYTGHVASKEKLEESAPMRDNDIPHPRARHVRQMQDESDHAAKYRHENMTVGYARTSKTSRAATTRGSLTTWARRGRVRRDLPWEKGPGSLGFVRPLPAAAFSPRQHLVGIETPSASRCGSAVPTRSWPTETAERDCGPESDDTEPRGLRCQTPSEGSEG